MAANEVWGPAERVVAEALRDHDVRMVEGETRPSRTVMVCNALRSEGMLAQPEETRHARIARINEDLREALEARFDDGSSVVEYILATRPELRERLFRLLE